MKTLKKLIFITLLSMSLSANAIVGSKNAEKGWESIVYITFNYRNQNDESNCSGFLINNRQVVSVAHCAIRDENSEKAVSAAVCLGKQAPFDNPGEACFQSKKIQFAHNYKYGTSSDFVVIDLVESIPLNFLGIQTLTLLPNNLAKKLLLNPNLAKRKKIISFGSRNFNQPSLGKKGWANLDSLLWDNISGLWRSIIKHVTYGKADDGAGLVVMIQKKWYLAGLLVKAKPDFFVSVAPFVDPCLPPEPDAKQPSILLSSDFKFLSINQVSCNNSFIQNLQSDKAFCRAAKVATLRQLKKSLKQDKNGAVAFNLFLKAKRIRTQLKYLRLSAKRDYPEALYQLYLQYLNGKFVRVNKSKATEYLIKAAKSNLPIAQYQLAIHLKNKELKIKQYKKNKWLSFMKKSAKQGYAKAQYSLGLYYAKANFNRSYNWIMRAARQGYAPAQYRLALYLLQGIGTRKNAFMAKKWLEYSAGQGYMAAVQKLKTVKRTNYQQ